MAVFQIVRFFFVKCGEAGGNLGVVFWIIGLRNWLFLLSETEQAADGLSDVDGFGDDPVDGFVDGLADGLDDFFRQVSEDIEGFLNVGLGHTMQPGHLLLACPPFVFQASGAAASLKPVPAGDVILFHADLARQIRDVPDGGEVEFKFVD